MLQFFKNLFGSKHERDVEDLYPIVDEINSHTASLQQLTDDELREKTTEFRTSARKILKMKLHRSRLR
jgi:preprotein translocase subunit SecA